MRRKKKGFATKKEALAALDELKKIGVRDPRDYTVSGIWEALWPAWSRDLSESKQDHYERAYKRLKPLWRADIRNLIAADWQEVIDEFPGNYDPKKDGRTVCSKIYKYALAQNWVHVNMAEHITLPHQGESTKDRFTNEEIAAFWWLWDGLDPFVGYILIMIYTGMRPGELRTVAQENVHLDEGYMVGGIKSAAGRGRCIAFPEFLRPVISWAMSVSTKPDRLMAMTESKFYEGYDATLEKAGIKRTEKRKMTPHCCRHTYMSLAVDAGIPLTTVQKMAGHSDVKVTAQYTHAHDPELIRQTQRFSRPASKKFSK